MNATYIEAAKRIAGEELAFELAQDVEACESLLSGILASPSETVESLGRHVSEAGGKRLRPLLVSLSARATGRHFDADRVRKIGACVEMVHMATLVHDDVIDEAEVRRGRPSAASIWGNTAAILTGDVLLAKAMQILAEDGDLRIIRTIAGAVVDMSQGEVMEVEVRGRFDLALEDHLEILRLKTATFMAACCEAGGLLADADEGTCVALRTFGNAIGIAFQIADDLLDYRGEDARTGKPKATDFREACPTLPLIALREKLSHEEEAFVRSRFGDRVSDEDLDMVTSWMSERGAFDAASRTGEDYGNEAILALQRLPECSARELLVAITGFVSKRDS